MTRDHELLAAVDVYFRALYHCDVDLLDAVFHPSASLFDVDEAGPIRVDPVAEWRNVVGSRPSPADAGQVRNEEVLSVVWLSPSSATVHVRLQVLDEIFVDHLCFTHDGRSFRIVAKTWHLERVLTPST